MTKCFSLLLLVWLQLVHAQSVFTSVDFHAGYFPDRMLPGLVADYNAERPWLTKPMQPASLLYGNTLQIAFRAPKGFWVGGNFTWDNRNHVAKGIPPGESDRATRVLRLRYNTIGLMVSHALLGSIKRPVSLHAEATLEYGHFMSKTKIRGGNGWSKFDHDSNDLFSSRFALVIRIKSDETDGSYVDLKPYYRYAFRDNLSFSQTGNFLVGSQAQTSAPYTQSMSHFGLCIALVGFAGGEEEKKPAPDTDSAGL